MNNLLRNIIKNIKRKAKKYYCVKQFDITDCGAACLATISKQYGLKVSLTKIREMAGTDKRGTNILGMIKAAEELGFDAKGVRAEEEDLTAQLQFPCIAHVNQKGLLHFVVVHEITDDDLVIADPAEGVVIYTRSDFMKIWTGVLILIKPSSNFVKADVTSGFFERFSYLILQHKELVFNIFMVCVIYTLMNWISAYYFQFLIDDILPKTMSDFLHIITLGFLTLSLFSIGFDTFRNHMLLYLSQKMTITLVLEYYKHVLKLPMSFFDSRKVGEILSRLNDAESIRSAISGATFVVMIDSWLVIFGGIVLYVINSKLFFITLLYVPFYIILAWVFSLLYKKIHRRRMEQSAEFNSFLVESISGIGTIKAFNAEYSANLENEKRFIKMMKSYFKTSVTNNIEGTLHGVLNTISSFLILWIGSIEVIGGIMTIGQLITFNALLGNFKSPLLNLINLQPMLQEAFVAGDRLGEISELDTEQKHESKKITKDKFDGMIEFRDVRFRYGSRREVLKGISLKIKPGEKIAIVGESGSGKTTLVKLLLKYYLPTDGDILIDNFNIKDLSLESIREKIGYIPQDVFLFSGTVRENIAFGVRNASIEEIIETAQKAQADKFINEMPLRYETKIEERGANLSGGQRQRIAIARAILRKPNILILDEATSNLDSTTEKAIHSTLATLTKDITTIIIAHRLSTILFCDRIIVLEDGQIIETGTHHELISMRGRYYSLWQSQTLDQREGFVS